MQTTIKCADLTTFDKTQNAYYNIYYLTIVVSAADLILSTTASRQNASRQIVAAPTTNLTFSLRDTRLKIEQQDRVRELETGHKILLQNRIDVINSSNNRLKQDMSSTWRLFN